MTCIVGVKNHGNIIMGGDSCGSDEYDWCSVGNPKVFRVGEFLIGCATSFRMIDLLRYRLTVDTRSRHTDEQFMRTDFIDAVIRCFRAGGFLGGDGGVLQGGNFLVGYRGKLYEIEDDFSVLDCPDGGWSVGSGDSAARGSLYTTRAWDDPYARVRVALEAAESIVPSVRGPFIVETLT